MSLNLGLFEFKVYKNVYVLYVILNVFLMKIEEWLWVREWLV